MPRSSQLSAAPWPRRLAQPLLILALAGCTGTPQLETPKVVEPGMGTYPQLVPLDEILAVAPPDAAALAQDEAAFDTRIAALGQRAARMRLGAPHFDGRISELRQRAARMRADTAQD